MPGASMPDTPTKMPPTLREALELLREPHERGYALAQARMAVRLRYNPQTITHWCSGRRTMGPNAQAAVATLIRDLHGER